MDAYIEIAEAIKKDVNKILKDALSGLVDKYRHDTRYGNLIKWGLVESDINDRIDYHLTGKRNVGE